MEDGIRALIAVDEGVDSQWLQQTMGHVPDIEVVGIINGLEEAWRTLQETKPELIVVACAGYSDRALYFVDSAVKQGPDRPVVVVSTGSPNGFVRRVFEAGGDDLITLPEEPERIGFALQKAVARRRGAAVASGVALAPMICVLGPKGGTGKTLVSTNLAAALAAAGHKPTLVDLDLQFGDVGLALGVRPDKTIYDLARSAGSLDVDKVGDYLVTHASGARVLLAPTRPDQASAVTVDFLRDLFTVLRTMSDYVIVDTPPGFTPEVIAAIDSSSDVCVVGMLDSLSLKNTKLGLETLELMGYDPGRISLVLNRADSRVGITHQDVDAIIGRSPDVFVPSDRLIPVSINDGVPIVLHDERSEAARAFHRLADVYINQEGKGPKAVPAASINGSDAAQAPAKRRFAWRS